MNEIVSQSTVTTEESLSTLTANREDSLPALNRDSPILRDLNTIWDIEKFKVPRTPVSVGFIPLEQRDEFCKPGAPIIRDMPIKFPGSDIRLPKELAQFEATIRQIIDFEILINPDFNEYYCYLEVDQSHVIPGTLQRELPCHVDGMQGARTNPKVKINHSYIVGSALPTIFYPQSFDLTQLDETKHNFFWEMNRQVSETNSASAFQGQPFEIQLMDAYSVHRGVEATEPLFRTWMRLSFEVRIFDRLGNTKNPMFDYDWKMEPRDIEALNLVAFDESGDISLRTHAWRDTSGNLLDESLPRTKPILLHDAEY